MTFVKDLDTKLLGLSARDTYSARDACGAIHFWGGIGGGKTSAAHVVAGAYLRAGMGACITATKSEDISLWQRYANAHGRANSLVEFDGINESYNFLDHVLAQQGIEGVGTVTECLMRVIDAARKASGTASHGGGEVFWEDSTREALRYTIPALYAADGSVSIPGIIRFVSTAPANLKEPTDRAWQERSFMYKKLNAALCEPKVPLSKAALNNAITYWSERWAATPEKTKGNVVATISATLDRFNHGRLQRAFCGRMTTVVPELSYGGALLLLAMPTTLWGEDALIAQQLFKFMWQRTALSRNSLDERHRERFLFLWSDEAQDLVNSYDYEFLSLCRSSKCCVTYLTQSLPTYFAKIGGDNPRDAALALAGKFMSHVFCSNSCAETNEFAAKTIGRVPTRHDNYSRGNSTNLNRGMSAGANENWGSSSNYGGSYGSGGHSISNGGGSTSGSGNNWGENRGRGTSRNESRGYSESMEYAIEPGDFGRDLLTGGPANGNIVTAVWFQAGRIFRDSGTNFLLARFAQ